MSLIDLQDPRPTVPAAPTGGFRGRAALETWVDRIAAMTRPDEVVWCDGSDEERARLLAGMTATGALLSLDPQLRPGSFLARSDPADVARVEDRTYICSQRQADSGPTNNWRDPAEMRDELAERFDGAMAGRTMYVVPFSMGPVDSPMSRLGVQVTDSPYVVVSSRIMTRTGAAALAAIGEDTPWVAAAHSLGMPLVTPSGDRIDDVPWPSNAAKAIAHFPETREIVSFGSGYGGNALLAKKCFALRIASVMARDEGWLAEHMLLIRLTSPEGRRYHVAAAFPSACGRTNFAMLSPSLPGWKVETIGDDIAWLRPGADGRLWAINPEASFFGVAPGTGEATNPAAMATMAADTVYTNVALTPEGDVWWEGRTAEVPPALTDWQGLPWTPEDGRPAAHPNARFTSPAERCPTMADGWDDPEGVPLDAIVFGGRRASTVPLFTEARDWVEGVFAGATIASERTAAAEGPVGELRFDPFAMLPFCGDDMASHWAHWLQVGRTAGAAAPRMFRVNWFRKDEDGRLLWPGFGENVRVLDWIVKRLEDEVPAVASPVGLLPHRQDVDLAGLELPDGAVDALLGVDVEGWRRECDEIERLFIDLGDSVPAVLRERLADLRAGLGAA